MILRTSLFLFAALALAAQSPTADVSGVWSRAGGGGAGNRNPVTQWSAEKLSFTPEGAKLWNANKPGKGPRQVPPAFGNDPMGDANPPGLYRTLVYNRSFEMIQLPGRVVQMFEWAKVWRTIWTDGRPVPEDIAEGPFWYGYSVGKWEGDTLLVETLALDERAWFDEWGTPFAAGTRVTERWRRVDPTKLELIITVQDPFTYQKPWTSSPVVYSAQKNTDVREMIFAPMDEKTFNTRVRDAAAGVKK